MMERVHVLGAGAIGLLFAGHISRAGLPVTLLFRTQASVTNFQQQHGSRISVYEAFREPAEAPVWQSFAADAAALHGSQPLGPIHNLVIATKAPDAVPALLHVLPHLAPGASCLLLQNGILGVLQQLQQELGHKLGLPGAPGAPDSSNAPSTPRVRLYLGSVTHGCYKQAPGEGHRLAGTQGVPPPGAAALAGTGRAGHAPAAGSGEGPPARASQQAGQGCGAGGGGAPTASSQGADSAPPALPAQPPPSFHVVHAGLGGVTVGSVHEVLAEAARLGRSAPHPTPVQHTHSSTPVAEGSTCGSGGSGEGPEGDAFLSRLASSLPGLRLHPAPSPGALLRELHAKLAANCAINPLTALLGARNGQLLEQEASRALMREVCAELVAVFGPDMFPRPPAPPTPQGRGGTQPPEGGQQGGAAQQQPAASAAATAGAAGDAGQAAAGRSAAQGAGPRVVGAAPAALTHAGAAELEAAAEGLYDWVAGVARTTARNRSSMLQDVLGCRRTEVDYLSGYVAARAEERGAAAPVHATLAALVRAREGLYGSTP